MDTMQFTDCFYLANSTKLYFIPYCDGDVNGGCDTCTKGVCKGWWGGDNREEEEEGQETQTSPKRQTREERVEQLAREYAKCGENEGGLSPLDYLSIPDCLLEQREEKSSPSPWERGYNAATQGVVKGRGRPKLTPNAVPTDLTLQEGNEWRGGFCEGLRCLARFPS